ncbi:hypothetical protein QTV49_004781 [Vibrio vulnificus]|nr:hypothetical protein [Vibrio vulnificus]
MKTKVLIFAALSTSLNAFGAEKEDSALNDVYIKYGGWSKHIKEDNDDYNYNETHNGIGIEWTFASSDNLRHNLALGYFQMTDSFGFNNKQGGLIYSYRPDTGYSFLDRFSPNLSLMIMDRGWIHRSRSNYNDYYFSQQTTVTFLPYLTYNITDYLNIDLIYIPKLNYSSPKATYFVRAGFRLNKLKEWLN